MAIQVSWYAEQEGIVQGQFVGNWTLKQFRAAWKRFYEILLEKGHQRIDFIIDLREIILIPPDFVRQFRQMPFRPQPNTGLVIFVGADEHMQLLIRNIVQALPHPLSIDFADTMEAAAQHIIDTRLSNVPLSA